MTMWPLVLTSLVVGWVPVVPWLLAPSVASQEGSLSLFSTLSKAHLGCLHLVSAFLRWTFSLQRSSGLLHTVWALWVRVWITLNFAERWWWLSHYRYWSMWIGFLYTVIDRFPSASGFTMVSKKGMAPSSLLFSTVNCMAGSTLLMCCRKSCLWIFFWMTNVSSTYLCQSLGVGCSTKSFLLKVLHIQISCNGTDWGTHSCTLNLFIKLVLEWKVHVFETKL